MYSIQESLPRGGVSKLNFPVRSDTGMLEIQIIALAEQLLAEPDQHRGVAFFCKGRLLAPERDRAECAALIPGETHFWLVMQTLLYVR